MAKLSNQNEIEPKIINKFNPNFLIINQLTRITGNLYFIFLKQRDLFSFNNKLKKLSFYNSHFL